MVVQAGGVGIISLGTVGTVVVATGDVAAGLQAATKKKSNTKGKNLRIFDSEGGITFESIGRMTVALFDRLLKFFERCHPCNRVNKIRKRIALLAQSTDGRADRILARRATWGIGVGSMKC